MKPFSYKLWAILMVIFAGSLNFCQAVCCKVLVVKGGKGFLFASFSSIFNTLYSASFKSLTISSASFLFDIFSLFKTLLSFLIKKASNICFEVEDFFRRAMIVQYS